MKFAWYVSVNAAIGKPSSQSSQQGINIPGNANDGVLDPRHGYCAHLADTTDQWWKVELGSCYQVTHVTITNRDESE